MTGEPLLVVDGVRAGYGTEGDVLHGVDLAVHDGGVVALLGHWMRPRFAVPYVVAAFALQVWDSQPAWVYFHQFIKPPASTWYRVWAVSPLAPRLSPLISAALRPFWGLA